MKSSKLFHAEIMPDTYLISSSKHGPTKNGTSLEPGKATSNSYLIVGEENAVLFDLAVKDPGLREYAKKLTNKPIQLVLSHGHVDHVYHLNEFEEVWMHQKDETLIRNGMIGMRPVKPCPKVHNLEHGDRIFLGNRCLEVFHVPGHTPGSLLLLDHKHKILFSGDTCARHLLYGMHEFVPFEEFCDSLRQLQKQEFEMIYSAHDRCSLPKSYLEHMISQITNEVPYSKKRFLIPGIGKMLIYVYGEKHSLEYFDVAVLLKHKKPQ